ncbi:MAG: tetratricopeptide repeat protein [Candidatus Krumholzibacteriota bacterium]|nr:tetratricopeptide repeat protein [Candidatus Krumholzibacteriota bacterium]
MTSRLEKINMILVLIVFMAIPRVGMGQERSRAAMVPVDAKSINRERTRARELIRDGNFNDAIILLEELREKAPGFHDLAELLARAYIEIRAPEKAVFLLEEELGKTPGRTGFVTLLGKAYLDMGQREKAVEVWHGILGEKSSNPVNYSIIADLEWSEGLFENAIATLREGSRHAEYLQQALRKLIRYETILEYHDSAFRDGLALLEADKDPASERIDFLLDSFRRAGCREDHFSAVDSLSLVSEKNGRYFRIILALLHVENGDYEEAGSMIEDVGLTDSEALYFTQILFNAGDRSPTEKYNEFVGRFLNGFIYRYPQSPMVPQVMLLAAESRLDQYDREGEYSPVEGDSILSLLDRVIDHRHGASYRKKAALLKARFLGGSLYRHHEAMRTLAGIRFDSPGDIRESERIKAFSLLAVGGGDETAAAFIDLSSRADSNIAALGRYAGGMLHFLEGDYEKAIEELSVLAQNWPASEWANDALETAMIARKAIDSDRKSLDIYAVAVRMRLKGEFAGASDTLRSIVNRYPDSVLFARAVCFRGSMLERSSERGLAKKELARFVDKYPLDDCAPKALELLGQMMEKDDPDSASACFGALLERYPEYPFISRVREKYIALKKSEDKVERQEKARR